MNGRIVTKLRREVRRLGETFETLPKAHKEKPSVWPKKSAYISIKAQKKFKGKWGGRLSNLNSRQRRKAA